MAQSKRRAAVIGAIVAIGVGSLAAGGTAWAWVGSTGVAARTVSTSEPPPTSTRTKVITFDAEAQARQIIDLPEPLPVVQEDSRCIHPTGSASTWPLFNGSTVTVPVRSVIMCPNLGDGIWGVTWFGDNGRSGLQRIEASATFLFEADGTMRPGMIANLTVGEHRYRYLPASDDFTGDHYQLTDSFYGAAVSTTLGATVHPTAAPTQPAATTRSSDAAPAVPVGGTPGYAG